MLIKKSLAATALIGAIAFTLPTLAAEQNFNFQNFTKIDVSTGLEISVTHGDTYQVRAMSSQKSALSHLTLSLDGQTLKAKTDSNFLDFIVEGGILGSLFGHSPNVKLYVTLPTLKEISASAGSQAQVSAFSGDHLTAASSSGAEIKLIEMTYGRIDLKASSGSDLEISGTCAEISAQASSGAQIEADELICKTGKAKVSSGADLHVYTSSHLDAKASSGGSLRVSGEPATNETQTSSGGSVRNSIL